MKHYRGGLFGVLFYPDFLDTYLRCNTLRCSVLRNIYLHLVSFICKLNF